VPNGTDTREQLAHAGHVELGRFGRVADTLTPAPRIDMLCIIAVILVIAQLAAFAWIE
jgi:hypothetical protein